MSDTGESTISINKRADKQAWPAVLSALRAGATLRVHHKIRRVAVEGLDEMDPRQGRTVTFSLVRRLEREGTLQPCGVDRYMLVPEGQTAHEEAVG